MTKHHGRILPTGQTTLSDKEELTADELELQDEQKILLGFDRAKE